MTDDATDKIELVRFKDPNEALGLAAHLLAKSPPLNEIPLGRVLPLIEGAIHREHYVFAKRAGRVYGVLGWAFAEFTAAESWVKGRELSQPLISSNGPCVLILCLQAESTEVARVLTDAIRDRLFPNHHLAYYIRVKRNRSGKISQKGVRMKRPGSRVIVGPKQSVLQQLSTSASDGRLPHERCAIVDRVLSASPDPALKN